jgi:hypothetical protein
VPPGSPPSIQQLAEALPLDGEEGGDLLRVFIFFFSFKNENKRNDEFSKF